MSHLTIAIKYYYAISSVPIRKIQLSRFFELKLFCKYNIYIDTETSSIYIITLCLSIGSIVAQQLVCFALAFIFPSAVQYSIIS